jgi:hypothetical protein
VLKSTQRERDEMRSVGLADRVSVREPALDPAHGKTVEQPRVACRIARRQRARAAGALDCVFE